MIELNPDVVIAEEETGEVEMNLESGWKKDRDGLKVILRSEAVKNQPDGPWETESDFFQFIFTNQNLIIRIIDGQTYCVPPGKQYCGLCFRGFTGGWCGYVLLEEERIPVWADVHEDASFWVHGGITFDNFIDGVDKPIGNDLQFKKTPEFPYDKAFAIGFDCAHAGDIVPLMYDTMAAYACDSGLEYRDLDFVKREIKSLAIQIAIREQILLS